jgi:probable HAF family extracellular repeat protein
VGWAHTTGNASHAALWKPGSAAQDLGTMGGPTSIAWGINKKNQIVGQSDVPSPGRFHAFLWQNGTFTDLGLLPGGDWSVAQAINDSGLIVGQASTSVGAIHAVLWRKGTHTIRDLGVLPGGSTVNRFSVAYAVNNRGQIVGSSDVTGEVATCSAGSLESCRTSGHRAAGSLPVSPRHSESTMPARSSAQGVSFTGLNQAFVWNAGSYTDLGFLPTGNVSSGKVDQPKRLYRRNQQPAETQLEQPCGSRVYLGYPVTQR